MNIYIFTLIFTKTGGHIVTKSSIKLVFFTTDSQIYIVVDQIQRYLYVIQVSLNCMYQFK